MSDNLARQRNDPMANPIETILEIPSEPNSLDAIQARIAAGQISWTGPLLLVSARSFLLIASQALVALFLFALHRASPWREAGYWWTVYGTLVDIGCLVGLRYFTRREGIRLRDLLGPVRLRRGHDVFLGLGYFLLIFPFFLGGGFLAQRLFYGASGPNPNSSVFHTHYFPIMAIVYSLSLWWMIWSPTEEATYQAYALPRFRALTGHTWAAFVIVGFWWAVQHCFLGVVLDWRNILMRFFAFLPGVLVMMAIYWRTRRLAPLIVAHWPMDIVAALMNSFQ
jgi:uncharacterized protein